MTKNDNIDSIKSAWQSKLLPLMTWMLVGLTIFFFFASFYQLYYLHEKIEGGPKMVLNKMFELDENEFNKGELEHQLKIIQWKTLATLDEHTLNQRYHQANVLLMARIWTRYLCFVTGMILCLVGASFILGKIEQAESVIRGKNQHVDFSLKTTSPGLVLAVLGTVLMMTAVLVHNEIKVTDGPAYLHLKFLSAYDSTKEDPEKMKTNKHENSGKNGYTPSASEKKSRREQKELLQLISIGQEDTSDN